MRPSFTATFQLSLEATDGMRIGRTGEGERERNRQVIRRVQWVIVESGTGGYKWSMDSVNNSIISGCLGGLTEVSVQWASGNNA